MENGDRLGTKLPDLNFDDPGQLEAMFGNFGFSDHWRKVVLANCREIERAKAIAVEQKVTESRLDDLARLHPNYISFLTEHLDGRRLREQNVLDSQFSPVR
jgi:hypothetical protein